MMGKRTSKNGNKRGREGKDTIKQDSKGKKDQNKRQRNENEGLPEVVEKRGKNNVKMEKTSRDSAF